MPEILLSIKNIATEKELIPSIKSEFDEKGKTIALRIEREEVLRTPILAKAPMGIPETVDAARQIHQLLNATSIVQMSLGGIIGNAAWSVAISASKSLNRFLAVNNKQKGNAWGAKLDISREVAGGKQLIHFFLDNIPERLIPSALESTQEKIENMDSAMGKEYMGRVKKIGFSFDSEFATWKMIGVELFNGGIETPEED